MMDSDSGLMDSDSGLVDSDSRVRTHSNTVRNHGESPSFHLLALRSGMYSERHPLKSWTFFPPPPPVRAGGLCRKVLCTSVMVTRNPGTFHDEILYRLSYTIIRMDDQGLKFTFQAICKSSFLTNVVNILTIHMYIPMTSVSCPVGVLVSPF